MGVAESDGSLRNVKTIGPRGLDELVGGRISVSTAPNINVAAYPGILRGGTNTSRILRNVNHVFGNRRFDDTEFYLEIRDVFSTDVLAANTSDKWYLPIRHGDLIGVPTQKGLIYYQPFYFTDQSD